MFLLFDKDTADGIRCVEAGDDIRIARIDRLGAVLGIDRDDHVLAERILTLWDGEVLVCYLRVDVCKDVRGER